MPTYYSPVTGMHYSSREQMLAMEKLYMAELQKKQIEEIRKSNELAEQMARENANLRQQEIANELKESYKHLKMVDVDEIMDDDEFYDEYDNEEDEYDEIDNLKDKYMKLRKQREDYENKSKFTPIQDVDWCIIVLAYIGAMFTIPFESVSTPLAFAIATIVTIALVYGQKVYKAKMRNKAEQLKEEMKQLRKEIKLKEKMK